MPRRSRESAAEKRIQTALPLTPRVKKNLELAQDEAEKLSSHTTEAIHVLLGISRDRESTGGGILHEHFFRGQRVFWFADCDWKDPEYVQTLRENVRAVSGKEGHSIPSPPVRKIILENATQLALARKNEYVGSEDLLWSVLGNMDVQKVLLLMGSSRTAVWETLNMQFSKWGYQNLPNLDSELWR